MKKWLAIGGLILVTVIWGGGFVASDMALGSMKPFQIMMVRFLLASVLMGMISMGQHKKEGKLEKRAGAIKAGILMGIALFAGFALQIIGLQYTTPSKNAFLTALNVVIVPFIAFIILKKKVGMKGIIGAIMSVIGVALLSLNGNLTLSLGDGLTLLCAVGFAFQIFFTGEFVKKYPASVLNMVQMITAFVLSAVSLVIFGENDFQVTTQGWLSVLYLGVISTTVCYLLQTACQKYVDETKAAIVLSMESVFGTIFSIIILHEVITLRMVIGCAIILAAVIILTCLKQKEKQKMKKYNAVIFDLDGVICHTDKYHYQAWKAVADELGIYFDEEINNRLRGVSRMESFEIILERYEGEMSEEEKECWTTKKNDIYKELLKNMSPADLSAEVKETLDDLRANGYKLAIGSSSKNARFILGQLGLGEYFDAISDGNNISKSKPDPEVFVKAAEYVDEQVDKCLVVEDAKAGLQAAIAGGMDCAAIGDAVASGLGTYNLSAFADLLKVTAK